jgi:hypothetical protein
MEVTIIRLSGPSKSRSITELRNIRAPSVVHVSSALRAAAFRLITRIRGIDGPVEVTPTAFHSNAGLIDMPRFVGRLEMPAQPLFQFGAVASNPTPERRVIRRQTALGQQLLNIAERQRVPKIQRTAPEISSGAVCRHLKIVGRLRASRSFQRANPAQVARHPSEQLVTVDLTVASGRSQRREPFPVRAQGHRRSRVAQVRLG